MLDRLLHLSNIDLAGVVVSTRVLRKRQGWLGGSLALIRRAGLRYALYLGTVTGLADVMLGDAGVRAQARRRGIPTLPTRDINDDKGLSFVADCSPQVLLSGFFNQRLAPAVCDIPEFGAVNIHPGQLPSRRGVDPVFFAKLRGDRLLQVTLHRVTPQFDCGPLLVNASLDDGDSHTLMHDTARLFCRGVDLFDQALPLIERGDTGEPQIGEAHYDSWPRPAEVTEFLRRGTGLFDTADLLRLRRLGGWCHSEIAQ